MKKTISLALALSLCLMLTACGGGNSAAQTPPEPSQSGPAETLPMPGEGETQKPVADGSEDAQPTESEAPAASEQPSKAPEESKQPEQSKKPEVAKPAESKPVGSKPAESKPAESSPAPSELPESKNVDLAAFYTTLCSKYELPDSLELASGELVDGYYAGLNDIDTQQSLVYLNSMSMNYGEIVLVQVTNSEDVAAVKTILQNRVSYMAGDGNGPGGAWYPEAMDTWENFSRVVSNGNYVMMIVNESCDSIVSDFNALF